MINCKHINPYKSKLRANKVKYIKSSVLYTTTHDMKVPFRILEFSSSKIKTYLFHVDNTRGDDRIRYDMIIGHHLIVYLGLKDYFGL